MLAGPDSDDVSVLIGNGDGTFADERRLGPGYVPVSIGVADLDGDGFLDLAVANAVDVAILLDQSSDCNNGMPDAADIASGTHPDCGGNRVPDECHLATGGDDDGDGAVDLADPSRLLPAFGSGCGPQTGGETSARPEAGSGSL